MPQRIAQNFLLFICYYFSLIVINAVHLSKSAFRRRNNLSMQISDSNTHLLVDTFFVVDMGSSSIRCSAYSCHENKVYEDSKIQLKQRLLDNDGCTDADLIFSLVNEAVDTCAQKLRDLNIKFNVKGLGFASFAMSLCGCDDSFHVVTPVYTYASRIEKRTLQPTEDNKYVHFMKTGTILGHPSYAPTHLHLFSSLQSEDTNKIYHQNHQEHQGQQQQDIVRVKMWYTLSSLIISRWTGKMTPISYSEASWLGLFDFKHLCWDQEALQLSNISESALPPLIDFDELDNSPFLPEYLQKWPEMTHIKLFLGVGDGAAAAIGSRCTIEERVSVTIGTSAAVRTIIPCPSYASPMGTSPINILPAKGLFCYRVDKNHVCVGGAMSDGGSLLNWMREFVGDELFFQAETKVFRFLNQDHPELKDGTTVDTEQSVFVSAPLFLPFWSGERSTGWHEDASGTISDIRRFTSREDFLLGIMEGILIRLDKVLQTVIRKKLVHTTPNLCIIVSGGVLERCHEWRQLLSDVTKCPVVLLRTNEDCDSTEITSAGVIRLMRGYYQLEGSPEYTVQEEYIATWGLREQEIADLCWPREKWAAYFESKKIAQTQLYDKMLS